MDLVVGTSPKIPGLTCAHRDPRFKSDINQGVLQVIEFYFIISYDSNYKIGI